MSLAFGIGLGGPTIGISTPLLDEDRQPTTIVHHHHYPLSEEQADLYMQQPVYTGYLERKLDAIYFYYDKDRVKQPKFCRDITTHQIRRLKMSEVEKLKSEKAKVMRQKDKAILMTEGIGGLEDAESIGREDTEAEKKCDNISIIVWGILFPCCLPCVLCVVCCEEKEKGEFKDVPKISFVVKNKTTGKVEQFFKKACVDVKFSKVSKR